MILICPSCGIRLEKNIKFCPNCGFDLNESSVENADVSICAACGEENKPGSKFCSGCGKKLTSNQDYSKPAESNFKKTPRPAEKINKSGNKKVNIEPPGASSGRSLSQVQILSIIAVTVGIVLIILIGAGVFDSTPVPATLPVQQQAPTQPEDQKPQIDLNTINEINNLEARVKANPDDLESLLSLAHLKNDAGLYEQAIVTYQEYLVKKPADADARVDMGVCYFNLKNYPTAIAEMKKALEYKPMHQIAHLNLGIVNLTSGNLEESKIWFKKAVEIDPVSDVGKRAKELLESH